ncbi:winged helix-turn-helix domain-containing protein [Phytohabitans sp. ZYX-F-186]|uniref:Winged helix-turn-helix domain-containing protein n=1 Tax=Phytohabitans maris TaxID=3071409 RepID=A0ABU0ZA53_9ACTN|nr:winged helix-turn-helix domain-containing protein [Phytohabitans sp. ZYX-F-186]MDQ7903933.1 winged helix-turn-helix domain-containing protein [Phytohabitans sp. ZYX-F-186]
MSVIAIPQRRHPQQLTGPGRAPRRPAGTPGPALTVTFTVPLAGESMSPHAFRLLEVVRDLVDRGEGTVTITPTPVAPAEPLALPAAQEPGQIRLSRASRTVTLGGAPVDLTRLEFDLLVFLAENPRRVFTRLQLLGAVWGYEHAVARTVDVHVRRLRAKIGDGVPLVTTVYGIGYRLADDARVELVDA